MLTTCHLPATNFATSPPLLLPIVDVDTDEGAHVDAADADADADVADVDDDVDAAAADVDPVDDDDVAEGGGKLSWQPMRPSELM